MGYDEGSGGGRCFGSRTPKLEKRILNDISGVAPGGELLAIMGPSGAGKTSLLDVLAGRQPGFTGSLALNGQVCTGTVVREMSAYVMQDDMLLNTLTPHEYMTFSASLRLAHLSAAQREERVRLLLVRMPVDSRKRRIC